MKTRRFPRIWTLAFPAILDGLGPGTVVEEVSRMGADELIVCALIYTGYRLVMPRHPRQIYQLEEGMHFYPVDRTFYDGCLIQPAETKDFAGRDLIAEAVQAGKKLGVGISVWTVLFANGRVAKAWPECAVENLYGSRDRLFLCFNHPEVRRYILAMTRELLSRYEVSCLMLDKIPQSLLELNSFSGRIDPILRLVGSICFCRYCRRQAAADGVDLEAAHARALELAESSRAVHQWTREGLSDELRGDTEIPLFLLEEELFCEVLRWRLRTVARFIADIRVEVKRVRLRTRLAAALVPPVRIGHDFTSPRAWLGAQSYRYFAPALDSVHAVIHWDRDVVAYDTRRAADAIRVSGAHPELCVHLAAYGRRRPEEIPAVAEAALVGGADSLAFFCQDLMEEPMIEAVRRWVRSRQPDRAQS